MVNGQVGGGTTPEDPEEIVDITTVTEIVQKEEGEKAKNSNYANKTGGNGTLKNTGETGDKICNIFDMAANLLEWTTEYSTNTNSVVRTPFFASSGEAVTTTTSSTQLTGMTTMRPTAAASLVFMCHFI